MSIDVRSPEVRIVDRALEPGTTSMHAAFI